MISIQSLSKKYGNKQALFDVNLEIKKGEIVGLLGLNGAGKSTLMNIISGCLARSEGSVLVGGVDVEKDPIAVKKMIGYLPEIPPLYVDMTVYEYLYFVCELKGIKGKANIASEVQKAMEKAGLCDVSKRLIKNLSKGYRQRVGVGSALLGDPQILILDEPTVGLDPTQIIEIKNLICELGKDKTVILSSHILSQISSVCRRVILLKKGRLIADGTPESLEESATQNVVCNIVCEGDIKTVQEVLESIESVTDIQLSKSDNNTVEGKFSWKESYDLKKELFKKFVENDLVIISSKSESLTLEDAFVELVKGEEEK